MLWIETLRLALELALAFETSENRRVHPKSIENRGNPRRITKIEALKLREAAPDHLGLITVADQRGAGRPGPGLRGRLDGSPTRLLNCEDSRGGFT